MGIRTTFGIGWWDPDAMVKICFQKITLTNILVRLVRVGQVGQVGQGWSAHKKPYKIKAPEGASHAA